jgi:type VI secretion system protein ImpE
MTPSELYQAGRLAEAVDAALQAVKKHPTDTARRGLLCELLCFTGDLERADKQLETIGQQDPSSMVGVSMFRQLLRAETARQQFFREGRLPEFLGEITPLLQRHLEASVCLREGDPQQAAGILAEAEAQRPPVQGICDGTAFDDLRDLDDLTAPLLEVLTSTGKYFWVPMERVEWLEFHPPQRPQDLLWRRAHMVVAGGPDGEVFLPALYPHSPASQDDQLRLGRGTQWTGGDGAPVQGLGQRIFLVGDQDKTILELKQIEFHKG